MNTPELQLRLMIMASEPQLLVDVLGLSPLAVVKLRSESGKAIEAHYRDRRARR